jgi:HEAT repeat protein
MNPDDLALNLIAQLQDPAPQRRVDALFGLIRHGGKVATILIEALQVHPDANVRWYAAYALGLIADPLAVPALIAALDDQLYVAHSAQRALEMIGTPEAQAAVAAWRQRMKP